MCGVNAPWDMCHIQTQNDPRPWEMGLQCLFRSPSIQVFSVRKATLLAMLLIRSFLFINSPSHIHTTTYTEQSTVTLYYNYLISMVDLAITSANLIRLQLSFVVRYNTNERQSIC